MTTYEFQTVQEILDDNPGVTEFIDDDGYTWELIASDILQCTNAPGSEIWIYSGDLTKFRPPPGLVANA